MWQWQRYLDKTFWKMAVGFIALIAGGLIGVYLIQLFDKF